MLLLLKSIAAKSVYVQSNDVYDQSEPEGTFLNPFRKLSKALWNAINGDEIIILDYINLDEPIFIANLSLHIRLLFFLLFIFFFKY